MKSQLSIIALIGTLAWSRVRLQQQRDRRDRRDPRDRRARRDRGKRRR